MVDPSHI